MKKNRRTLITKKITGSRWQRRWQPRSAGAPSVCVCVCESCCKLNVRCKVLSHSRRPVWFSPVEQADLAFRWLLEVLPRWHIALSDFHSPPPPPSHSPHVTYILCRARYLLHRLIVSDSQTSDWFAFVNTDAPDGSARGKILPETVLHWCTLITFFGGSLLSEWKIHLVFFDAHALLQSASCETT